MTWPQNHCKVVQSSAKWCKSGWAWRQETFGMVGGGTAAEEPSGGLGRNWGGSGSLRIVADFLRGYPCPPRIVVLYQRPGD